MIRPPAPFQVGIWLLLGWLNLTTLGQAAFLDDNGNGMSDIWEKAYGTTNPTLDPDGDGQSNLQESVAGTDPNSAISTFNSAKIQFAGNAVHLAWPSIAGKKYQVQVATELGKWQNIAQPLTGDGLEQAIDFPLATTFLTGKVLDSCWDLATGETLAKVKSNAAANVPAKTLTNLTTLTIPQTAPDANLFGHWVRGWLIPPATGAYQFWIASDDSSELWLSTNATVGNKVKIALVSGYTNYQQWEKYPSQTSALINLTANVPYYFEAYQNEGTGGDHLSVAWSGPGIASKTILDGKYVAASGQSLAEQVSVASSLFFRVVVSDVDTDGDGVSDADEWLVGYKPNSTTTIPRVNDAASLRSTLAAGNVITVGSPESRAYESSGNPARLTFFRSGNLGPLTISYTATGTATSGADYLPLTGLAYLPIGQNSVSIDVTPKADSEIEPAETVRVQVNPGSGYTVGSPASATVTIDDAPDVLFIANLRPDPALRSGGYGTASLNVAGNAVFGNVGLSFGNLLRPQVRSELYISNNNGATGNSVFALPAGQVSSTRWEFASASGFSRGDILQALSEGRLYARVVSDAFPDGEVFGQFVANQGWQTMPLPPTPPTLPITTIGDAEAARFLTQTTFGPTRTEIDHLKQVGYNNWLEEQWSAAATLHLPYVQARRRELIDASTNGDDGWQGPRQEAWWQSALTAPDQLRQRMAFALSEIFVVSDIGVLDASHEGITNYYDMLVQNAFGNYRDLLEKITLSPIMGQYLSMVRNQKSNPTTGAEPDENYARECMQLFSIGLSQLNLDGSLKLDAHGMPIPTYSQADIVGLAHVFTGWSYQTVSGQNPNFLYGARDEMNPMVEFPAYHDTTRKVILNNTIIPANQTMSQDLKLALDTLFNHPNVGPFIARQLIQRFVSSNPSPGYIYRVTSIFNNNGSGVRGDLKATLKAVLLDYEARSSSLLTDVAHGKQKEPIIRFAHLLRAMKAAPPKPGEGRFFLDMQYSLTSQAALKSPSVFNFFQPGYIPPGTFAYNGLYAPEYQITSETTVINQDNNQHSAIFWGLWTREKISDTQNYSVRLNLADQVSLLTRTGYTAVQNQTALLDNLNVLLLNGRMSAGLRQNIMAAYVALPTWFTSAQNQTDRVNIALWIIMASPEYSIQR